uniref:E2 ubiquitin-conjugating enzyme n=1 Tax=Phlebotomus papatasi TaxID=29031 RepID=A0A1B0D1A4_PHLPP
MATYNAKPDLGDEKNDYDSDSSETVQELKDFSDNFSFSNLSTCWVCNGYYGPCFGQPVCGTCHAFLFPAVTDDIVVTQLSDDEEDSGNDEPPQNSTHSERVEEEDNEEIEDEEIGDEEDEDTEEEVNPMEIAFERPKPNPPRNLNHYLELLSAPRIADRNTSRIELFPVEVLLKIFSYLDDISLWNASEVCEQWRRIIQTHTSQTMWKKYTRERWPLFQQIASIGNWFDMYSALMASCFCRTCLFQMSLKTPLRGLVDLIKMKRLRSEITCLRTGSAEGIDAVPLDNQLSHWQGSILGPPGSPYEGGKFFLYIVIPQSYPMSPPTVRFLTKIVHPNVSRHGDVGIDIIQHNWSLALTISKILLSVQSLLTDPFTEICMEPALGQLYDTDRSKFEGLARNWTWKYAMHEVIPPLPFL